MIPNILWLILSNSEHHHKQVVKSEETSGAVTGSALGALSSLLRAGLFYGGRPGAIEAMSDIVDGVSGCRFEFTDARCVKHNREKQ
jgi:hypothetical protein